jgi:predicted ATP-binding protein involved in virulence
MYITTLELTNYRGARSLQVALHPQLTAVFGVNGAGKSTILDAVATLLTWAVSRIRKPGASGSPILEDDIRNGESESLIAITLDQDEPGHGGIRWHLSKGRTGRSKPRVSSDLSQLNQYAHSVQAAIATDAQNAPLPVFVHYPVTRAVLDIPLRIRGHHAFDRLAVYRIFLGLKPRRSTTAFYFERC